MVRPLKKHQKNIGATIDKQLICQKNNDKTILQQRLISMDMIDKIRYRQLWQKK